MKSIQKGPRGGKYTLTKTGKKDYTPSSSKPTSGVKSNDRLPPRTKQNMQKLVDTVNGLPPHERKQAQKFVDRVGPEGLFDVTHGMRRWYSGQTQAGKLLKHREALRDVMDIEPRHAVGSYRGFKVPKHGPLGSLKEGQKIRLPVTRNRGISSWSTNQDVTNRFSGAGKGKVGLVVQLAHSKGIKPILAPPDRTKPWFNSYYDKAVGSSFRPNEGEYLVSAPSVVVRVVKVKR